MRFFRIPSNRINRDSCHGVGAAHLLHDLHATTVYTCDATLPGCTRIWLVRTIFIQMRTMRSCPL